MIHRYLLAAAFALATPAGAATLDEARVPGGDFSGVFTAPTVIGADVRRITGGQARPDGWRNDVDVLMFDGFAAGTERLDIRFTNPLGGWGGYNLRIKTSAFAGQWDWYPLALKDGGKVSDGAGREVSFAIADPDAPLWLAMEFFDADFQSGGGVRYDIALAGGEGSDSTTGRGDGAPSVVPLPPAGALMLAGLGALGLLRRRRRG